MDRSARQLASIISGLVVAGWLTTALVPPVGADAAPSALGASVQAGVEGLDQGGGDGEVVTLVTGQRVAVGELPDGRPHVTVLPGRDGADSDVQILASGEHVYVIPRSAAAYLGRPLDIALFDVANPAVAADVPVVDATFVDGASPRALPGTEVNADGDLVVHDRAAFGAALDEAWSGFATTGEPGRLFDGVQVLAPFGGSVAKEPPPGALHTLTVRAVDRRGRPVNAGDAVVTKAENVEDYLADRSFYRGEFSVSVPTGHYSVSSYIGTVHPDGGYDITLATVPEVYVARDTKVTLDARRATQVTATTPNPTSLVYGELNYQRDSAAGIWFASGLVTFGATRLYAVPTDPVDVGQVYFYPFMRLGDATGSVDSYMYDLEFAHVGSIPAELDYSVTHDQLATVEADYHSPQPGRAEVQIRQGVYPWQGIISGGGALLAAPLTRTEYVTADPELLWLEAVVLDAQNYEGSLYGADVYGPGEMVETSWAAQPMASGLEQRDDLPQTCPACRSGDSLMLSLFSYVDSAGHVMGSDPTVTQDLTLYRDDTEVATVPAGRASFPMSPESAAYRLVYDVSRDATWWPSSTDVHTEWTFTSQAREADPLPPGWICPGGGGRGLLGSGGGGSAGCSVEPLLLTSYTTNAGTDDVIPAGETAVVDVSVGQQRGRTQVPVVSFAAGVSFDDGQSWRPVDAASLGDGKYRLEYDQPGLDDTSGYASLRIDAEDADGNTVSQELTRAYPLAVAAAAERPSRPTDSPQAVCAEDVLPPYASCQAMVNPAIAASLTEPSGLTPRDIRSAYGLEDADGEGRTVAVVVAYDNPNAEADLAVYRDQFGLPPCTTANGCFRKVNQRGDGADLPDPSVGWGLETSLDLDAVSAACPSCDILLVEADSASLGDLIPAVHTAARLGADVISNSYGSVGEFSGQQYLERYYRDLKVPLVVASGDYGFANAGFLTRGVSYPAASQYAVAVGGTSLVPDANARGWSETAWEGATSGCSAYIRKPAWQRDTLCGMRTVADVSAVADPYTGLAVYDTFGFDGWLQVGGTSLAAPIVASVYAMADTGEHRRYAAPLYQNNGSLFDVVGGSNGQCSGTYLCTGVEGYDAPTGLGTPNGVTAFRRIE